MHRHYLGQVIQYWDLTAEKSPYIKYGEFHNFRLVGHLGLRFQNEAMYINGLQETLFMHRHYLGQVNQYWDLAAERSQYVKYGESCYFPLVGYLGLRFQNEAMYINYTLQTLFMNELAYPAQVIHSWDMAVERSSYVKYVESRNFLLVSHLGPRFQNEAMYINWP